MSLSTNGVPPTPQLSLLRAEFGEHLLVASDPLFVTAAGSFDIFMKLNL